MPRIKKPTRGGRRPGAGRKPSDPSGLRKPITVWISPAEREHCEKLAGGSAAAGVRRLIAESMG